MAFLNFGLFVNFLTYIFYFLGPLDLGLSTLLGLVQYLRYCYLLASSNDVTQCSVPTPSIFSCRQLVALPPVSLYILCRVVLYS